MTRRSNRRRTASHDRPWNHNIEYHRVVHDALADSGPGLVLEVGCGEGVLAGELRARGHHVVGLDLDRQSVERARARVDGCLVIADFTAHPFRPAAFDAVVSVAALHHMDEGAALEEMAHLLRPGGVLAVVGLALEKGPSDLGWLVGGAFLTRVLARRNGGYWEPDTPKVWPPPSTYGGIRRVAEDALPGVAFRRRVLWRYSLVWRKPEG